MLKVDIFTADLPYKLKDKLNDYLSCVPEYTVVDIKYQMTSAAYCSAMVIRKV